jgi:hypothetical protein
MVAAGLFLGKVRKPLTGGVMHKRDLAGLVVAAGALAGFLAFRVYIEPRAWGALCVSAAPPLACLPRGGLIWMQRFSLWGSLSLAFGLWGFAWCGGFAAQLAAVILGIAAVENYNATWGALGLALGAWAWMRREGWPAMQQR